MFSEFPAQNTADWLEAITKILKGQSAEVLQTPLYEGFSLKPFYHQDDALPALLSEADFLPFHTCLNVVPVYATNVAEDMIIAEEWAGKGADLVCFVFYDKNPDIAPYINQSKVPFGIQLQPEAVNVLENIYTENDLWLFSTTLPPQASTLVRLAKPFRKMLHTDFQAFEEAGANAVQTIAFGFSLLVENVEKAISTGLPAQTALQTMRITTSIAGNYFVEIAKLRAIRVIWRNILQAYQVDFEPLYIHACATNLNKMTQDAYNNLLRNTTEAMASLIGGADSFMSLPYTSPFSILAKTNEADEIFADRIARNTLILLKEEAHLDKVTDASAGSFYIETLTKTLAEKAWALFQITEAKGGFSASQDFRTAQIASTAQARKADFEAGKTILVGVNKYIPKS